tara:strand:+ start:4735 stop:5004 length:270 start_codon:yes stop_codon:yes gene_type:complete
MNKKKAKEIAYAGDITYGQLQELINNCDRTKPCKINKNITREQALTIMERAIKDKEPNERPNTTWFNHRNKLTLTGDGINAMNILVECS